MRVVVVLGAIGLLAMSALDLTVVAGTLAECEAIKKAQGQEAWLECLVNRPGASKPSGGTCECNVYIEAPEYCAKLPFGPSRDKCRMRNDAWLEECHAWLRATCIP